MRIRFGRSKFKNDKTGRHPDVVWDADQAINAIMVLAGTSGVGKTYRLRRMMEEVTATAPDARFHVVDVHGDIQVPGMSSTKFSESTGYGLNPLKISDDPDFGGVRKRCRSFISMLNQTSRKLGTKQESCLLGIMEDMYRSAGFYAEEPRTWSLAVDPRAHARKPKRQPVMSDLLWFSNFRLRQAMIGAGTDATHLFDELMRAYRKLERAHNQQLAGNVEVELDALKEQCKIAYCNWIDAIEASRELDEMLRSSTKDVVKSVQERIQLLDSAGIFKERKPDFDKSASVWRYEIRSLNTDEQILFVNTLVEDLFVEAKQGGEKARPTSFLVLDEAQKFVSEDPDHIINVVCREARKFGMGIILASQSISHFPEDVIANAGCKVILGLDESFHDSASRKLKIEAKRFSYVVPQKTALIQVKNRGDLSNRFVDVVLDAHPA